MSEFDSVITPGTAVWKPFQVGRMFGVLVSANSATGMATGASAAAHGVAAAGGSAAAVTAAGAASVVVGALAGAFLGAWAIAHAHIHGRQLGEFNAFITAFADAIYHLVGGGQPRWRNTTYPDAVRRGRNAAGRFLRALDPEQLASVRRRFRPMGEMGSRRAIIQAFGGYKQ